MKSGTNHLSTVTHAAEAATQETHCSYTRHVPRRVPHPCPCTIGVMKLRTNHLSAVMHAAEAANTGDTLQLHLARTKTRASSMPVHKCNEIKNGSFICNHACSRGHGIEDTLQLHKARTKAHASSMPMHNRCNEIKNKAQHLLGATHATEAMTQETHCSCTRHVPRRVPRPCPCATGVLKSRKKHNIY